MASLTFKDFDLNQTCITGRRKPNVTLDDFRPRYKVDAETKEKKEEIDCYVADIVARNRIQSVKIPTDAVKPEVVEQITTAIKANKVVTINFGTTASTLRGKCYALINRSTGQLISGVSCTASELNVVAISEPEIDDFDDIDDVII